MASNTAPTFTIAGTLTTSIGTFDFGEAVLIQPDGRILVAGRTVTGENTFTVVRYNADGTLDTTFDGDGKVTTSVRAGAQNEVHDMALQSDGKIVVVGSVDNSNAEMQIVRYNPDGSLDTSFGGDGRVTTAVGTGHDVAQAVIIQADGKILVGGRSDLDPSTSAFALVRYNSDGSLDTTFDGDGKVVTPVGVRGGEATGMVLQPDGKIVLSGYAADASPSGGLDFALVRYNTDGTLDSTFGTGGRVTGPIATHAAAGVTLQPDGRIIAVGESVVTISSGSFAVARYNTNGSFDSTFGGTGVVQTPVSTGNDVAWDVVVQPDGRIVVVGDAGSPPDFALVRYNSNGTLDATFGAGGKLTTDFGTSDRAHAVALQADGRIVVAGARYDETAPHADFALARYNSDGSLDRSFGPLVDSLEGAATYLENGPAVVLDRDVQIYDAELAAQGNYGAATLSVARHGGANAQDVFTATGSLAGLTQGAALVYSGVTLGTVTVNSGGTLVLTFNSSATQTRVNGVLQSIAYANSSDAPPAAVELDWIFTDGNTGAQGTGGAASALGSTIVTIGAINDTPVFAALGGGVSYTEGNAPVVLDADVGVLDAELSAQGSYTGATLRLVAHSGANAMDVFSGTGALDALTEGSPLVYSGVIVGTVTTNSGGTLVLTFNGNATQARVNGVLEAIAYSNISQTPPSSRLIDWHFSDGNTGAQGSGGARVASGSTDVTIVFQPAALWSELVDGHVIGPVDPASRILRFDDTSISAASVQVTPDGASTLFSHLGKTVTVQIDVAAITARNIAFADGSMLLVGDATTAVANDGAANALSGGAGNDQLIGLGGNDALFGGGGDDLLIGGAGADDLDGGAGFDTASYGAAPTGVVARLSGPAQNTGEALGDSYASIEGLIGSAFNDTLVGNNGMNRLQGIGGDDYLQGIAGNDIVTGGAGNDRLEGGVGADMLDGGDGSDYAAYYYAAGAVTADLANAAGNTGEAAFDSYASIEGLIGSVFNDVLSGDASANIIGGLAGNDRIAGRGGNDGLLGLDGDDTLDGGTGADRLDGGAGLDHASYGSAAAAVRASLAQPAQNTGDAAGDSYRSIEGLIGSTLGDTLEGNVQANDLQGANGNDTLIGGAGADTLDGGAGFDYASYASANGNVLARLGGASVNTGDAAGDAYLSIEGVFGSRFDDTIVGNASVNDLQGMDGEDYLQGLAGNDTLRGGSGGDRLEGGAGADILDGGAGVDYAAHYYAAAGVTVDLLAPAANSGDPAGDSYFAIEGLLGSQFADVLSGDNASNVIAGFDGDDLLAGRGGNDVLQGMSGADTLDGGAGADRLAGGAGNDAFAFTRGEAHGDALIDFAGNGAAAGDRLVFHGYGTAAQGATFVQIGAARWRIDSADGTVHEIVAFINAASIDASDYAFI
ncbi:MAG TPA: hypothetical protein VED01_03485 [Burkholderiales bacterium]|nr:hypothetical protein [Burkholderiales bacterium]